MLTALQRLTVKNWRLLFYTLLVIVLVLALVPPPDLPSHSGSDKLHHALAFTVLTLLLSLAHPTLSVALRVAALLAYGLVMEALQSFTTYRSAEWSDLLADTLGILLGLLLARALYRRQPIRPPSADASATPGNDHDT